MNTATESIKTCTSGQWISLNLLNGHACRRSGLNRRPWRHTSPILPMCTSLLRNRPLSHIESQDHAACKPYPQPDLGHRAHPEGLLVDQRRLAVDLLDHVWVHLASGPVMLKDDQ